MLIKDNLAIDGFGDAPFLVGPYDPVKSSEEVTLAITAVELPSGTVLGKLTAGGQYVPWDPAAADGSQTAVGILYGRRPISAAAQKGVLVARDATVNFWLLKWLKTSNDAQKLAAIASLASPQQIIVRK